jgi:putative nucleotidyltransferase with HDIG domain
LAGRYAFQVGDVSPVDIRSPQTIEYTSESLTEEARLEAERRVPDVYEPQRRVRSDQVRRSREILDFISSVRADGFATDAQKLANLLAIPDIQLTEEAWNLILSLEDAAWQQVRENVPIALNVVMLGEIRDNQLVAARRKVPTYIDLEDEEEADAAIALVRALVQPNTTYNAERTEALRQEARETIPVQTARYEENEIIVRQGDILTELHIEALNALGLAQRGWDWWEVTSSFILALVMGLIFGLFLFRTEAATSLLQQRRLGLLTLLLAIFLLLAKLMVPSQAILPYIFPLAALTMLTIPTLGMTITFLVTIYFAIMVALLSQGSIPILTYTVTGALVGALVLDRGERTSAFVRAGTAVTVVSLAILAAFNLPPGDRDLAGYAQLAMAGLLNGLLTASITLIGFYLLGALFDIATPLRLMELARPNHPLLRDLIMKTPGTYHHSLLVSNLAEQAAEAISADAFLTRVGAYYHDIGKLARPYFFVENRLEGANPHDQLDPWSSAQIIISHIKDGLELARRHKLPKRIQDFIAEHQGTGLVRYFYHQAQQIAGEDQVDESDFRYPGPKPQSKETALLMLADSCESAVRASRPESKEEIDEIVRRIINQRLIEGELSDSDLTLRDLETIRQVFVRSLQGVHHPRVKYPETKQIESRSAHEPEQAEPEPAPAG